MEVRVGRFEVRFDWIADFWIIVLMDVWMVIF